MRIIENKIQRITFRELHLDNNILTFKCREFCSWNNVLRIIENKIQRITFRELHLDNNILTFISLSYLSCARNKLRVFIQNKKIFQNFSEAGDFVKQQNKKSGNLFSQEKIYSRYNLFLYIFCVFFVSYVIK